jgi:predicted AlkP superfamily phosphohydrolase/phosphomutase
MSEPIPPTPPAVAQVRTHLHTIARLLREVHHLSPEAQARLAELVDELGQALESDTVPSAELAHLTECAAQLVSATQRGEDEGLLNKTRERLDRAALAVETEAPLLAGLARRLAEALTNLGI